MRERPKGEIMTVAGTKNGKHHRKMTERDVKSIVNELNRWADRERGSELTWAHVEAFAGFTKPALWAKPDIKKAFQDAKAALRHPDRKSAARVREDYVGFVERQRDAAQKELADYKECEQKWLARWQCIAYHLQQIGRSIDEFDKPLPNVNRT